MSLSIDEILAADNLKPQEVPIPEWGGTVFVRTLSALEAIRLSGLLQDISGDPIRIAQERVVMALSAYLCDADGNALATVEQARAIAGKRATAVNAIVEAGHRINSVDANTAEGAAKN